MQTAKGMKGMHSVIGIDIGTSATKTVAVDQRGKVLASATAGYPLYQDASGFSEQEPKHWWEAVQQTLRQVLGNVPKDEVQGVSFSGQMHGLVALDAQGNVLRRAILWNDQRTAAQCRALTQRAGGEDALLAHTNNRMLTGYTAGKLLWVKEHEPELYARIACVLNPKDYIRYCLTGERVTEVSDASGTGMFDVQHRQFDRAWLSQMGFDPALFPPCVESTQQTGCVGKEAAEVTGLRPGTPVFGGAGDAVISTTGMGLTGHERIGVVLGTSGVVAVGLGACVPNPEGKLQVFCNCAPGLWHAMGVTLSAAGSLQWFHDNFGAGVAREAQAQGRSPFALWDVYAQQSGPGARGLRFLPYLSGERCPVDDPCATGAFVGIRSIHDSGDFARAVMEGVAFSLRDVHMVMRTLPGYIPPSEMVVAGGGSQSRLWRQILADVFGIPVLLTEASGAGGAYGAALLAGVGCGMFRDLASATRLCKVKDVVHPGPDALLYERAFAQYQRLYRSLCWLNQ